DALIKRRGDPPALTFLLGYESTPIRADESLYDLATWARTQEQLALYLERTPSAQVAAALSRDVADAAPFAGPPDAGYATWPEFRQRFGDHLIRFGHAIYDLDFAKAVPVDDPAPLLDTLKYFLTGQATDARVRRATAAARREQA